MPWNACAACAACRDQEMTEADWAGLGPFPVLVTRNVTLTSQRDDNATWPLISFGFVPDKVRSCVGGGGKRVAACPPNSRAPAPQHARGAHAAAAHLAAAGPTEGDAAAGAGARERRLACNCVVSGQPQPTRFGLVATTEVCLLCNVADPASQLQLQAGVYFIWTRVRALR